MLNSVEQLERPAFIHVFTTGVAGPSNRVCISSCRSQGTMNKQHNVDGRPSVFVVACYR